MNLRDALSRLREYDDNGDTYTARCPAHEDKKNCLTVIEGPEGQAVFNCSSGCSDTQIVSALESLEPSEEPFGEKQADQLVEIARRLYRFGRTEDGEAFAVEKQGPNVALLLSDKGGLRSQLARAFNQRLRSVPSSQAMNDAITVLEAEARESDPEKVSLRVGRTEGGEIVIDLGDAQGRGVVCGVDRWEVVERSPILFHRTGLTGILPPPVHGGQIEDLFETLNVSTDCRPLVTSYLVACLLDDIPHPIALLSGLQGSGKSTAAEQIASVVDPGPVMLRTPPRGAEEWVISASASWIVCVDNVSSIPPWWSDALCRTVTGDGMIRRKLYSDKSLTVISQRRVVMLTSIDPGALRGDLADRIVYLDLDPIDVRGRRAYADLGRRFKKQHPGILGALLDLVCEVLAVLPDIHLDQMSRMADFNRALAAVDRVLGTNSLELYLGQRTRVAEEVLESDPVAVELIEFMHAEGYYEGTAGELRKRIKPADTPRMWPQTDRKMGGILRRLTPDLKLMGIRVEAPTEETRRRERSRKFRIEYREEWVENTVPTVTPSQTAADEANEADPNRPVGVDDRHTDRHIGRAKEGPSEESLATPQADTDGRDGMDGVSTEPGSGDSDEWGVV